MAGRPLKNLFPFGGGCEGKTRTGEPCGSIMVYRRKNGSFRCKWHASRSTGPKTVEGKQPSGDNLRKWWAMRRQNTLNGSS
jgi:hypothetical protein